MLEAAGGEEEGGEGPLTDVVEGARYGLSQPDASFSGVGKKGLASAFFKPFYLATE